MCNFHSLTSSLRPIFRGARAAAIWIVHNQFLLGLQKIFRSPETFRKAGAGGGSRTHTALRPTDFESAASAIPPLRRAFDSTRPAPPAKALLAGRSVSKLRITV